MSRTIVVFLCAAALTGAAQTSFQAPTKPITIADSTAMRQAISATAS